MTINPSPVDETRDTMRWPLLGIALLVFLPSSGLADDKASAPGEALDLRCGVATEDSSGKGDIDVVQGMSVIEETRARGKFQASSAPGSKLVGVFCVRSDIVPAEFDYKVLMAGYPLTIFTEGADQPERIAVLEMVGGRFQYRKISGPDFTPDIQSRILPRLNAFQDEVQSGG